MTVVPQDLIDWTERAYIGQYAGYSAPFQIYVAGAPGDPDGESVTATWSLQNPDRSLTTVSSRPAVREGTGLYDAVLQTSDTQQPGEYELVWTFTISGIVQAPVSLFTVGPFSPAYNTLPAAFQQLAERVWVRFADLFDSPQGGPNLQTYYQSHWSRGRVAQMLAISLSKLNSISQPVMTYSFDGTGGPVFPLSEWSGVLETQCYCECVRHLIRSYVEQPLLTGGDVTRLDRRDYIDRWQQVLNNELADLKDQLDVFKIRHMGFGNPKVMVSGGVYGRYAPTRIAGSVAARPRMWARWY